MPPRLKPLAEQTIVITGATSGNGLATARAAARRGASLVLAARNGEALSTIAEDLRAQGAAVETCVADVAVREDVERIAQAAIAAFGGFDTWVNDAAVATYGRVDRVGVEDQRRIFDVNYFGLLQGMLIAAEHLRDKGGAIVNIGSVLSDRTSILQGPYSASKHAVKAITDAMRMELHNREAPISITLIKPSAIHTPYPEHARNYLDEPIRLPPILYDPRLVADAILFAAEHPRRELYVGGFGYLISFGGRFAPRIVDRLMEMFGRPLQTDAAQPTDPAARDNLYEPRKDGAVDGHQDYYVRRTSLFLGAQKHRTAIAIGAVAAAAGAWLAFGGGRKRRIGKPAAA